MAAMVMICGFQRIEDSGVWLRVDGEYRTVVATVRADRIEAGKWGFTIWNGDQCLTGRVDRAWGQSEACEAAAETLALLRGRKRIKARPMRKAEVDEE